MDRFWMVEIITAAGRSPVREHFLNNLALNMDMQIWHGHMICSRH